MTRSIPLSIALSCLTISGTVDADEERQIEALRPTVIFVEDYEDYDGNDPINGQPHGTDSGSIDQSAGVSTLAGGFVLQSKQLVVSEGLVSWETKEIELDEPLLTSVSVDLTAVAGAEGFDSNDRVRMFARLSDDQMAPRQLLDVRLADDVPANSTVTFQGHLPIGSLAERFWDNDKPQLPPPGSFGNGPLALGDWAGVTILPEWMRIVMVVETQNPGNYLAIDNIEVKQETTVIDPERWLEERSRVVSFTVEPSSMAIIPPETPSLELSASYRPGDLAFDVEELGEKGEICLGSRSQLETQRFFPVEFMELEFRDSGIQRVYFRMSRPPEGWRTLPQIPGLFVCKDDAPPQPIDEFMKLGKWNVPPWGLPQRASIILEPESADPIEGSDPFVDFNVRIDADEPYPLTNLDEEIAVFARIAWVGGETVRADFRGVGEVSNGDRTITLNYRLRRPEYGWPTQKIQIDIVGRELTKLGGDGFSNFLRVAPGRSAVELVIPSQSISPSQDSFTVDIEYISDVAIDIETIGDGDLIFEGSPRQMGKVVSVEQSNDDRFVRAAFEFKRDPFGIRDSGSIALEFPSGAVSNIEGGTTIGISLASQDVAYEQEKPAEITASLVSLNKLSPDLQAYRFRIHHESALSALKQSDFDQSHIVLIPESSNPAAENSNSPLDDYLNSLRPDPRIVPVVISTQVFSEGRGVQVDYRVDKPEGGWLDSYRIRLQSGGVRDLDGGSSVTRDIAVVGRTDLIAANVELIGGRLIEGDPDTHRLSFLVQLNPEWINLRPKTAIDFLFPIDTRFGTFEGAYPTFVANPEMLPALQEGITLPPALGRFASLISSGFEEATDALDYMGTKQVLNLEIDRPEGGWNQWEIGRVPYVIQAPGLKLVPSSAIASGYVTLEERSEALPLVFSYEDWLRELENRPELPPGSLKGDADGDGQDGIVEFALGSDLNDRRDIAKVNPDIVNKAGGMRHIQLTFTVRTNSFGITGELQYSSDGKNWKSVDDDFELVENTPLRSGVSRVRLATKESLATEPSSTGLFRIAIVR